METSRRDEIAASVAAWRALGPGYDDALAEGLVERIGAEIDNRVAALVGDRLAAEVDDRILAQLDRYAGCRHQRRRARRAIRAGRAARGDQSARPAIVLALGSMTAALLFALIALRPAPGAGGVILVALAWIIIGVINLAYAHRANADRARQQ